MSDLLDDFFKRDLTEQEKKQLAKELSASSDAASRFARLAEEFYQETGLPKPLWKDRDWPSKHSRWWILKPLIPLVFIAALFGFMYLKWSSQQTLPARSMEESVVPIVKSALSKQNIQAVKNQSSLPQGTGISARSSDNIPSIKPEAGSNISTQTQVIAPVISNPAPTRNLSEPSLPALAPAETGLPALPPAGRKYQELSVVVERHTSGIAKVTVLNKQNAEIRVIYSGILPAGERTFTWDGRMENGSVAPPGDYSIEVKSGENILRHKVRIDAAVNP